ncbi:hypothetical protein HDU79_005755 [Rhizoclosmatium sp. JEL0117]|nr:hypothetical protein HDU79_005755 [Rhizoclosmatium sp. JEL0117]
MPAVLHYFQEFAADFYNARFFAIEVRHRFACRFIECFLPIGIWVIMITQARDLASFTAPWLNPLWGTEWALSIIGGPVAAVFLYGVHSLPLQEPLPSSILLAIEFSCDAFFGLLWLIQTCVTAGVLTANGLACPFILHPAPTDYYVESTEVPATNIVYVTQVIWNNATTSSAASLSASATSTFKSGVASTLSQTSLLQSTITSAISAATTTLSVSTQTQQLLSSATSLASTSSVSVPHTSTIILVQSKTCYPLLQNLSIFNGLITAFFFLNIAFDVWSYMKGVYWDYDEFTDRSRAETMATIRKVNRFGLESIGIGKGEYARSRRTSRYGGALAGGSRAGSRLGSTVQRPGSKFASAAGSLAGSTSDLTTGKGLVAGQGILAGSKPGSKAGSKMGSQADGLDQIDKKKKEDGWSNMKGASCAPRVGDSAVGPGLSALKMFTGSSSKSVVSNAGSRDGSVASLLKKSGR